MKYGICIAILLSIFACGSNTFFGGGFEMDLIEKGLSCKTVDLRVNNKVQERNTFTYGEIIELEFNGIEGFARQENLAYPGCSIYILNEKKDTVDLSENIFKDKGMADDPLSLPVSLQAGMVKAIDKSYMLKIKIWDKKGTNQLDFEMPFTIIENEKFNIKTEGVEYSAIYFLSKRNKIIVDNIVSKNDGIVVLYEGVDGLAIDEIGYVYPGLSIDLIDKNGTPILKDENMLKNYSTLGYKAIDAKRQIEVALPSFKNDEIANPVELTATLFDLNSDNKLILSTTIEIK